MEASSFLTPSEAIVYLSRSDISYEILGELESWDHGGCYMFAIAVKEYLEVPTQLFVIIKDNIIDHFVLYSLDKDMFYDSEGWHTISEFGNAVSYNNNMDIENIQCDIIKINKLSSFIDRYLSNGFILHSYKDEYSLWSPSDNFIPLWIKRIFLLSPQKWIYIVT